MTKTKFAPRAAALMAALALTAAPVIAAAAAGVSDEVSARVTVKSVDLSTRHLVVTNPEGDTFTLKVSDRVRNLDRLRPGDRIRATYYRSVEFELVPAGKPVPPDSETDVASRAHRGELPAGVVGNRITVTGAVVGVDRAAHRVKLVSPQGGQVHEVSVRSAEGRRALQRIKVGDKITARITEGLLVTTRPG